jgi:hypothetical protein
MRTILVALLVAAPLAAQQPSTEPIPRELALALIDRYGPRTEPADIVVGRLPPSFPERAVPPGGTILGGIERPPGAAVVVAFRESPDTALARLVRHVEGAGWKRVQHGPRGGFVMTPTGRPQSFCRDDISITLFTDTRSVGGSIAQLNSWKSERNPTCDEIPPRHQRYDRMEFPSLHAPPGVRMLGAGMGGGGRESFEAFTRVETSMHSISLAAHYAKLLADAGWTMTGPTVGEGLVVYGARGTYEKKRAAGILYVLEVPATQQRDVVIRVVTEESER